MAAFWINMIIVTTDQPWKNCSMYTFQILLFQFSISSTALQTSGVLKLFFVKEKKFHWNLLYMILKKKVSNFCFFSWSFFIERLLIKKISKIYNYMEKNASEIESQLNLADISKTMVWFIIPGFLLYQSNDHCFGDIY